MKYAIKKFATLAVSGALLAGAGIALPAYAETQGNTQNAAISSVQLSCIDAAIDAREIALIAALDPFTAAMKAALEARRLALTEAWKQPTAILRKTALQNAWKSYQGASKAAHDALRAAKKTAWDVFKTSMRACGQGSVATSEAQQISTGATSL